MPLTFFGILLTALSKSHQKIHQSALDSLKTKKELTPLPKNPEPESNQESITGKHHQESSNDIPENLPAKSPENDQKTEENTLEKQKEGCLPKILFILPENKKEETLETKKEEN